MNKLLLLLLERKELLLSEGASVENLSLELQAKMSEAKIGTQFGNWLGKVLMNSDSVEELFLSDSELNERLKEIKL